MSNEIPDHIYIMVPKEEVEFDSNRSTSSYLRVFVERAAWSTVKKRKLCDLVVTIDGYTNDPRELFEIKEVCEWAKKEFRLIPSLGFFLAEDSRYAFCGWLCGSSTKQEVDSTSFLNKFNKKYVEFISKGVTFSADILRSEGAEETLLSEIYLKNLQETARARQEEQQEYEAKDEAETCMPEDESEREKPVIALGGVNPTSVCPHCKKTLPAGNAQFCIYCGTRICLGLFSKQFQGKTLEEATAKAKNATKELNLLNLTVIRDTQDNAVKGMGNSPEAALKSAKTHLPDEAFEQSCGEIVQQSQIFSIEILAHSEEEAVNIWKKGAPEGTRIVNLSCVIAPTKGFLGYANKPGSWKVDWSTPFMAKITYKTPAIVKIEYKEEK